MILSLDYPLSLYESTILSIGWSRRPASFFKKVLTVCLLSKQRQREWPEAKGSQVVILEYILDMENWVGPYDPYK